MKRAVHLKTLIVAVYLLLLPFLFGLHSIDHLASNRLHDVERHEVSVIHADECGLCELYHKQNILLSIVDRCTGAAGLRTFAISTKPSFPASYRVFHAQRGPPVI